MFVHVLNKWFREAGYSSHRARPQLFHPALEGLEDRCTPAKFLWNPASGNPLNWTIKNNWDEWGGTSYSHQSATYPGDPGRQGSAKDSVVFDANPGPLYAKTDWDCYINTANAVTIEQMTVTNGYSSNVYVWSPLTIGGTAAGSGISLHASAPTATLRGMPGVGAGTINMNGSSAFGWQGGNLVDLFVFVNRSGGNVATANVVDVGNKGHTMLGTVFHIDGQLNWAAGNVAVGQTGAASGINISSTGEFNIGSAGEEFGSWTWGVGVGGQTQFFQFRTAAL